MSSTARKRVRSPKSAFVDGPLALAVHGLFSAVGALCSQRPYPRAGGGYHWTDSRYQQLKEGVGNASVSGRGHTAASSLAPLQVDYLKLALTIDGRAAVLNPHPGDTPGRLRGLTKVKYRPQDTEALIDTGAEIKSWVKAIDDLMAPAPIFLKDPCPECQKTHAYRWSDDGQRVRAPALALTVENGAWCQNCHATWDKGRLGLLAQLLGYRPLPGVVA